MKTKKALVLDWDPERQQAIIEIARATSTKFTVEPERIGPPGGRGDTSKLEAIAAKKYDLAIAPTYGSPSGKELIKPFKKANPKGRIILHTDKDWISVADFNEYKLANSIIEVSSQDLNDPEKRTKIRGGIDEIMIKETGLVFWKDPLTYKKTKLAITTVGGLCAALAVAITRYRDLVDAISQ